MSEFWDRAREFAEKMREDADAWASGRSAVVRLPLLAYLMYGGVRHTFDSLYSTWFAGITLAFHEMGHLLFIPFGRTLTILGGSIMQLLVPTAAGLYLLLRQRDFFGLSVGGAWLGYSQWEMATYMADAVKEELGLVGFGGNPEHDWHLLFGQWHMLSHCGVIATFVRICAFTTWGASMVLGVWLCWRMWEMRDEESIG